MTTLLMSSTGLCNNVIVCDHSVLSCALDRGIRAGCAAAGSTVRQFDFSSIERIAGAGVWRRVYLANNQKQ